MLVQVSHFFEEPFPLSNPALECHGGGVRGARAESQARSHRTVGKVKRSRSIAEDSAAVVL